MISTAILITSAALALGQLPATATEPVASGQVEPHRSEERATPPPHPQYHHEEERRDASQLPPVSLWGFADFVLQGNERGAGNEDAEDGFYVGQFELDLSAPIDDGMGLEMAIAYNGDEGFFEVGSLFGDFHLAALDELLGVPADHDHPVGGFFDHSGFIVGVFDVPFGIDWDVYPSYFRKLVSGPLVVEETHDEWNDTGIEFYFHAHPAGNVAVNLLTWVTNGFGYDYTYENEFTGMEDTYAVEPNYSVGARMELLPFSLLCLGASYAAIYTDKYFSDYTYETEVDEKLDMSLLGADLRFEVGGFALKGEYIKHTKCHTCEEPEVNSGFYAQALYDFGPVYLVARHGMFAPAEDYGDEAALRDSVGIGWAAAEHLSLRFEYQANSGVNNDAGFLQAVYDFEGEFAR